MPRHDTRYWLGRFLLGVFILVLAGLGVPARIGGIKGAWLSLLAGLAGFWLALRAIGPLVRLLGTEVRTRRAWGDAAAETFARASLPRRIYYLLAAIAEIDGPMSAAERETVRHFLLERFLDPVQADDLRAWEGQPLAIQDRKGLAARIASGLDAIELDSLFCWCCLVAFADGRYHETEHAALHEVAAGLGLPSQRARMLFHMAREQYLRGRRNGSQRPQAEAPADVRARAFAVLGLPPNAPPEQVRRRHRELVRRFHPDAQPNLGPVAQREATERFHEIQRAYETLNA
jgi:DnaJ-domain-containing protein 1